jgi:hypothetical protein
MGRHEHDAAGRRCGPSWNNRGRGGEYGPNWHDGNWHAIRYYRIDDYRADRNHRDNDRNWNHYSAEPRNNGHHGAGNYNGNARDHNSHPARGHCNSYPGYYQLDTRSNYAGKHNPNAGNHDGYAARGHCNSYSRHYQHDTGSNYPGRNYFA